MPTSRQKKRLGKEQLLRVISYCRSISERGLDPFLVDVKDVLEIIHKYFPEWTAPEELCLDAEAIKKIAEAINLQSEWVKHRSTSLYTDPFLIEEKLHNLAKEEICTTFLQAWHPIADLEQISLPSLAEATDYWENLIPLDERWRNDETIQIETETTTRKELVQQQIIAEQEFSEELEAFWHELKQKANSEKIEYWSFIGSPTYVETVRRAYMTSFLVTYGYATLEVDRLEEMVYIRPFDSPITTTDNTQAVSLPISISNTDWKNWKAGVKD